ncbi:hypothetical protein CC1G_06347 [Coprinopsis cinerea okayama7|uniref:J domain-containing protein n=1 Tax=Coprinopsis cinerea (strain Okayama-7 / 130 / ATCC MYA-4618 / FGSC 9003) TaxID=240176 RepID=A8NTL7_COPC7|nr:hypothetical protein CC1G_06347 [Coprinopsis cinerea okayama7\|eukprot:XP_001836262.2 hypothetical protein CC1G_06347 [Coprinopsis cinerea okayama7\
MAMLSYAISTGTSIATNYFHLPFDEEEDEAIENYERKYLTWVSEPTPCSQKPITSPSTSSPPSPAFSDGFLSSGSSSASLSSLPSSASSSTLSDFNKPELDAANSQTTPSSPPSPTSSSSTPSQDDTFITTVINENDLYSILGVPNSPTLDKMTLRRAYLSRSRACHPDKFPGNPRATEAFQRVAVAYDVLSTPALRRRYDSRSSTSPYDVFAARPTDYAEETLRSVIIGVFNDFLDGDLEVIRTLLNALNDVNPGVKLGDEGINSILASLHSIREPCRVCVYALHTELTRLLEAQHAFSQLSYFDIMGRTRVTIQLTRITVGIPLALERALLEKSISDKGSAESRQRGSSPSSSGALDENSNNNNNANRAIFPRNVMRLIRGIDVALDKMEKILK